MNDPAYDSPPDGADEDEADIYSDPARFFAAMQGANPSLPTPSMITPDKVRSRAASHAERIFNHLGRLQGYQARYRETIWKRWVKKSTVQRRHLLTKVWPEISAAHRPDFQIMRRVPAEQIRAGSSHRDAWLLPALNLEDLTKQTNLLLFMDSRARHLPHMFVNADFNSVHLGLVTQALVPAFLNCYTMLFAGQSVQEQYGKLVSWDDDNDAFDMMTSGLGLQPGEGLLLMEIQERKLQFLAKCAETIVQDLLQAKDMTPERYLAKYDESFAHLPAFSSSERPSLYQEIEEAQYKGPDQFDIGRLSTFVRARLHQAKEHIWSLREDPSFFQDTIFNQSEHRQERILTAKGKSHPALKEDIFWERVVGEVTFNAYGDLICYSILFKEVEHLAIISEKCSAQPKARSGPPKEFTDALGHFEHLVTQLTKGLFGKWKVGMVSSPPIRHLYVRDPQDPNTTRIVVRSKPDSRKKGDHLLWLLESLMDEQQTFLAGLENICDELERELRRDNSSRERISSWIADLISDFSLFGELKRQVDLASPGNRMNALVDTEELHQAFDKKMGLLKEVMKISEGVGSCFTEQGFSLDSFQYPVNKRRTKATTERMQKAESNLDKFWTNVDRHFIRKGGKSPHELCSELIEERALQRTATWVEPDRTPEHNAVKAEDVDSAAALLANLGFAHGSNDQSLSQCNPADERVKVKTRGTGNAPPLSSSPPHEGNPHTETNHPAPIFKVSKRGFKVFSILFHISTSYEEPPGDIAWSEFLSAMASIGFGMRKLNGSAWILEFKGEDGMARFQQSIIVHEPHPSSRMQFHVARRIGRRLERTFGWSGRCFVRS